jgi:UDP-N-acetylmuramoyl-tripeptide--D-alanyl-D-alanine ligase
LRTGAGRALTQAAATGYWRWRGRPKGDDLKMRIGKMPWLRRAVEQARALREVALARKASRRRTRLADTKFIGVTGSSGKSTSVALLDHILAAAGKVAEQHGSNTLKPLVRMLARMSPKTDFFVAECAVGHPGSMAPMAAMLRPDMAVVTLVALEHKSAFGTTEAVADEKGKLVAALGKDGVAVLNADDPLVAAMAALSSGRVVTFGRESAATYCVSEVSAVFPQRLSMTITGPGGVLRLKTRFVGEHFWLPAAAAAVAALELGVSPALVAERVATFETLPSRNGVVETATGTAVIMDTIKAPWHSIPLAFETLKGVAAPRRRIFLGHISDYKGSNNSRYAAAYEMARAVADEVVFIGNHRHRSRASQEDIEAGRFRAFATPREAADYLRASLISGEVILVKGSIDMHLERLGLQLREEVGCWVAVCGKRHGCIGCRRYGRPFEQHRGGMRVWREVRKLSGLSR